MESKDSKDTKSENKNNTKYIFTELNPSVLTAQGFLSHVEFFEEDLIQAIEATVAIKKIICNYGVVINPDYKEEKEKKKTSNRGRKPKEKKKNIRKSQGTGKCFGSQISFWVMSDVSTKKLFKIKAFRNGRLVIPGGLEPSIRDVRVACEHVRAAMAAIFVEDVELVELYSVMRNYKFRIKDIKLRVNLDKVFQILFKIKQENTEKNLYSIKYNVERYPGLNIKFSTPIKRNKDKRTTIKMFKSGKVNIDGAISVECANKYYNWMNNLYTIHKDDILYMPRKIIIVVDSSSDEESDEDIGAIVVPVLI
jgi:TATA-box binding protein (TBP) (component of TFIID and TFIIIB)